MVRQGHESARSLARDVAEESLQFVRLSVELRIRIDAGCVGMHNRTTLRFSSFEIR